MIPRGGLDPIRVRNAVWYPAAAIVGTNTHFARESTLIVTPEILLTIASS